MKNKARNVSKVHIPKKVRIDGHTWRVKKSKTLLQNQGLLGLCSPDLKYISIDATQTLAEQNVTFLHELLHAIFPQGVVSDKKEEVIVGKMEQKLHDILVKNKIIR